MKAADLGELLRGLRRARGISQADLAAVLDTNRSRLADIERGKRLEAVAWYFTALERLGCRVIVRSSPPSSR